MPAVFPMQFLVILEKSFAWEGGLANLEHDAGGLTNMGVTIGTYSAYLGRPATPAEMSSMTRDTAIDVYYKLFWVGNNLPAYPDFLRLEIFNSFTGSQFLGIRATKALQGLLGLTADGIVGPKSEAKFREVEKWASDRRRWLNNALCKAIILELIRICKRNPTQLVFIEGWFNRYSEFFDTIDPAGITPTP